MAHMELLLLFFHSISSNIYRFYDAFAIRRQNHKPCNKCMSDTINIVFIADLHLGDIHSERKLESIVRNINSLSPDIVCIAITAHPPISDTVP